MLDPLVIITPCSRPENLPRLRESIKPLLYYVRWYVVYDSDEIIKCTFLNINFSAIRGGIAGKLQINYALDLINYPAWIYVLDDDNILHPNFLSEIVYLIHYYSKARGFLFDQQCKGVDNSDLIRHASPSNIHVGGIDQAQFCIHTDLIGTNRYEQDYNADGMFIEKLYWANPDKFIITNQVLSYYNYLRT